MLEKGPLIARHGEYLALISDVAVAVARILVSSACAVRRRHLEQFVADVRDTPGRNDSPDEVLMRGEIRRDPSIGMLSAGSEAALSLSPRKRTQLTHST